MLPITRELIIKSIPIRHHFGVSHWDATIIAAALELGCKTRVFQDLPVVLFEVVSDSTARIDREEKLRACQTIASLRTYAIVEERTRGHHLLPTRR